MFNHNFIELQDLTRIDSVSGPRLYETPEGNKYPSVTSILGSVLDKSGLDSWRESIGEKEADRVTNRSAKRGTKVHSICEDYIHNRLIDPKRIMPLDLSMFRQIEKVLEANVNKIRISEGKLYSDKLKVAGTVDLVAEWRGKDSIIDFKTGNKSKPLEWIEGYFLQTAMYSYMVYERTGLVCSNLVIIIGLESENEAQVEIQPVSDWIDKAFDLCKKYHLGVYF